ncbi:MAG: putative protease with the C-terminal domain [Sphingobacteriales bacterium]|nr:putative protease with the C-terminal domain [Sphingobacteriales bacterium]
MKQLLFIAAFLFSVSVSAQNKYSYTLDLKNVVRDKVSVDLIVPELAGKEAIFSFAKAIPGSYAQKDYGRFIENLIAFDKNGVKLKIVKLNNNQYQINNANQLRRISYEVNDTWDEKHKNFIFQPGGSNIEAGKNFVLNNYAFCGYFENQTNIPFEISIQKPANLFAATHLTVKIKSPEEDFVTAKNFFTLSDNPIMYAVPDTTSFMVGKSKINVAVASATGKVKSTQIAEFLKPMSKALEKFFNGLPVDSYQFLYFFEDPEKALINREKEEGGYGALEHNYSSLYYLPEIGYETQLKTMVNEVSSHEFLHILTPLNLHSEEIESFDFTNPKMSKHLWLYEGVTEYFANLVQLQNGLLTEKEFFKNMNDKINQSEEYGNFSMTEMSTHVMEDSFQKKYNSVYNKGALIAFFLDLAIREKTEGKSDLKTAITDLVKKYGPNKPFRDESLFGEIVAVTHPEIKVFIDEHISGNKPLPLAEYFNKVGYEYLKEKEQAAFYVGQLGLKYDEAAGNFVFTGVKENKLDIKEDDIFVKVDEISVTTANLEEVWEKYFNMNITHPELAVLVKRNGSEKLLKGTLNTGHFSTKNYLGPVPNKTDQQTKNLNQLKAQN